MGPFPVELWSQIVADACTDGGRTGCALSLVSRTMKAIVEPVRYNSVSLIGTRNISAFAERIAAFDTPPTIRHLFISFTTAWRQLGPDTEEARHGARALLLDELQVLGHPNGERVLDRASKMYSIFAACADSLLTLVVLVHDYMGFDPQRFRYPTFPLLQDLTIDCIREHCDGDAYMRFPSLRRLHVLATSSCDEDGWLSLGCLAPRVTHLKLSGLYRDPMAIHYLSMILDSAKHRQPDDEIPPLNIQLVRVIDIWIDKLAFDMAVVSRLSAVRTVVVEPAARRRDPPAWWPESQEDANYSPEAMRAHLEYALRRSGRNTPRRLVVLPETDLYPVYSVYKRWLEVVSGEGQPIDE